MSGDIIQTRYHELDSIAVRFGRQAELNADAIRRVTRSYSALVQGGWEGKGSAAFQREMQQVLFPALRRLSEALLTAQSVTIQIKTILEQAEQEAARPFRGAANGAASGQGNGVPLPGDPAANGGDNLFALKTAAQFALLAYKNRFIWQGWMNGVRFVKDGDMWRLYGSRAAKEAMGVSPYLNRFGPNAIQKNLDDFSALKTFWGMRTAIKPGEFGPAARQLMRNLTQAAPLTPAATFMQRFKGPAIFGAVVTIGMDIHEYGLGKHKDIGIMSRQFFTSTGADLVAGAGIVGVSTAIGTAIPVPIVGTVAGFAVGTLLQLGYDKYGKEAWRGVVDGAGQRVQQGVSALGSAAVASERDIARGASDVADRIGDGARDIGREVQNKWNDAQDSVSKLFRPQAVLG